MSILSPGRRLGPYEIVASIGAGGMKFKTEIRVARRIAHRNVVRTYDFGDASGIKFISMEFIQRMTLKQLIRSKGALPLSVGLQIAKQAAAGLVAAHEFGVVHRDVKPHNIMLTPSSDVKIMDFGNVRDTRDAKESGMTQTGIIMGRRTTCHPSRRWGRRTWMLRVLLGVVSTASPSARGRPVSSRR